MEMRRIDHPGPECYPPRMTSVLELTQIPDDLAAEAAQVPGLPQRLLSFIRAEVSQHHRRRVKRSMEVEQLSREIEAEAEEMKNKGVTPEQAKKEFLELYDQMVKELECRP